MKVKLNTFDQIKQFINVMATVESDTFLKHNHYCVDAASIMGIMSLDLGNVMELEVVEKRPGETEAIFKSLDSLGVIVHE